MRATQCSAVRTGDSGFSLVEVVIAMLMLGLMSLALLPLLIGTMKASVENRSLVTATAIANDRIAEVRAGFRDDVPTPCSALDGYVDAEDSYPPGRLGPLWSHTARKPANAWPTTSTPSAFR